MTLETISQALLWGREQLSTNSNIEDSVLESQLLLAYTINQTRSFLLAWPEKSLTLNQALDYINLIQRRSNGEPIAYILGHKEFWSLTLRVTADTLIPRPESELIIETVLPLVSATAKIADLGTGSGAIALALAKELPKANITATDKHVAALNIAKQNAQQLKINNIIFKLGEWCLALDHHDYDVIISNPPYIAETQWHEFENGLRFEPRSALVSGGDGLVDIRVICEQARRYLHPSGYLVLEHGYNQAALVREILMANNYYGVISIRDLAGIERITLGQV